MNSSDIFWRDVPKAGLVNAVEILPIKEVKVKAQGGQSTGEGKCSS